MKKLFVARQYNLFEKFAYPFFEISEDYRIIDTVLEDEQIIIQLAEDFPDVATGRNRTPVEQTLRFLVLKHQKALSYRDLEQTLQENLADRWFCKVTENSPCFKTLQNQLTRITDETIHRVNDFVMLQARERKLTKGKRMRVDSTVTEANIHYPTDATLLADGIRVLVRVVKQCRKSVPRGFRTFARKVKREIRIIRTIGRRSDALRTEALNRLVAMGEHVVKKVRTIRTHVVVAQKKVLQQIIVQTKKVMNGEKIKDRIVSIFELSARALPKGKPGKLCEFGSEVQVQEDERFITHWQINQKHSDTIFFPQALAKHQALYDKPPAEVTTDRGYWSRENQQIAQKEGVRHISLAKKGKANDQEQVHQKTRKFKQLQRWRAGGEAKISWLKRSFKLDRCRYQGVHGMALWVGAGILACNVMTFARVIMALKRVT